MLNVSSGPEQNDRKGGRRGGICGERDSLVSGDRGAGEVESSQVSNCPAPDSGERQCRLGALSSPGV